MDKKKKENSQAKLPAKRVLTEKEKQRRTPNLQKEKELRFNEEKLQNIYPDKSVPMFLTSQN